jgi:hypothetical protein
LAAFQRVPAGAGVSVTDLDARGLPLTTAEALAVAQSLFEAADDEACPPFGPLSRGNIILRSDGSVTSKACAATPTVLEAAILVEELLPHGHTSQVPGALRYALGRALHEVAAPPFDSLSDFSRTLRRFETGARAPIVRALYARAQEPPALVESAWDAIGLPFAAALLAGVALIGAGEAMHLGRPMRTPARFATTSGRGPAIGARPIVFNPPPLIVRAPAASTLVVRQPAPVRHVAARRDTTPPARSSFPARVLRRIRIQFDEL